MKKTLAFMLAMLCIFTAIPPIAIGATDQDQVPQIITNDDMDEETSYELGDLNLDGKVNMDDTTALMRHVLMAESITDEKALELCEVTGDDAINMDDVTKLMRFVLKAIDKLDPHTWQDATCTEPMTCLDCGKTKGSPLGHSYTIATQHMEDDISNVQMVCERCGGDGQTYSNALHISEKNALYLMQVATDFSFKVVCDQGLSYVQENVKVVERFYSELYEEQLSQIAIELNITEIDSNLYLVAPKNEYEMAESYTAILSEDLCFEDYPGTTLHFSTPSDEGKNEIEYNEDIYFLKNLTDTSYTLAFNEETTTYLLTLSGENMVSEELVEKILVVGECRSAEELKNATGETVIGKVDLVYSTNGTTMLVLSAPSLLDVYSKLDIVNSTANELSEVLCTEEYETQLLYSLMESESFAEALTTTTIAAENYANANGLKAGKGIFDLSNFKITPVTTKSESGQPWVEGKVTIEYNHSIPLKNGDADYGSIDFKLVFVVTVKFSFEKTIADFKIVPSGFFSLEVVLNLELDILQTTTVDFTLDITLSVQDPDNEEVLYIVSRTPKIHEYTCIHCESLRKDTNNLYTLKEIQEMFPSGYTEYECSWCKPFTMDTSKFALNVESKVLHCGNCTHLDLSTKAEFRIYKMYPVGVPHTDCEHCQPGSQLNKGDLEKYLEESMQDSSYSAILEKIKNTLYDKLKGDGASGIDRTKPSATIPIAQIFEVAVYFQPKFDFDLNASLHFDYHSENKCMYMVRSGLENFDFYIRATTEFYEEDGNQSENWELEIKGEAEAKIGVMAEATFSFVGMSRFVYVGIFAEAGAYAKLNGILHANSNEENYYGAYTEAGIYLDVAFTYALPPFTGDDSVSIIDDLRIPLFKGGDPKAYYAFTNPEAEIVIVGDTKLNDELLSVKYYDLSEMQAKEGNLSWKDNNQYSLDYRFIDSKGYVVKYCKVENGNLVVSDDAPDEFTVTMYLSIIDEKVPSDLFSYLFTPNKNSAAFFLGELEIQITYSKVGKETIEYNGNQYVLYDASMTWQEAKEFCEKMGGHLVTITSKGEQSAIETLVNMGSKKQYWLGLDLYEDQWVTGEPITYTNWDDGQPDGLWREDGEVEHYIQIYNEKTPYANGERFGWNDIFYDNIREEERDFFSLRYIGFICEIEGERDTESIELNGNQYILYDFSLTWQKAKEFCEKMGGHLVTITSQEEQTAIEKLIANGSKKQYWLGMDVYDGQWITGEPITYTNWDNGQPDDQSRDDGEWEHYLQIYNERNPFANPGGRFSWNDVFYDNTRDGEEEFFALQYVGFICEIEGENGSEGSEGLEYALLPDGKSYEVIGVGTCTETDIVIPSKYNGLPVTSIGNWAFEDTSDIARITSIKIPNSVTNIGAWAFAWCRYLVDIEIPNSITNIGNYAFSTCASINRVEIPNTITSIAQGLFSNCSSLVSIEIPNSVINIGVSAFSGCASLASIEIPNNVICIEDSAFYGCRMLTSIVIPDSVTSIGDSAFVLCSSLTYIKIPNSIISIGKYAFECCRNLMKIDISNNITVIEDYLFRECNSLASIEIPNGATRVGERAFESCNNFTSIEIPDGMTIIEYCAFKGCKNLTSIVIPKSVTSIGEYAFGECVNLSTIYFKGTELQWQAIFKGEIWDYYMPEDYEIIFEADQ